MNIFIPELSPEQQKFVDAHDSLHRLFHAEMTKPRRDAAKALDAAIDMVFQKITKKA